MPLYPTAHSTKRNLTAVQDTQSQTTLKGESSPYKRNELVLGNYVRKFDSERKDTLQNRWVNDLSNVVLAYSAQTKEEHFVSLLEEMYQGEISQKKFLEIILSVASCVQDFAKNSQEATLQDIKKFVSETTRKAFHSIKEKKRLSYSGYPDLLDGSFELSELHESRTRSVYQLDFSCYEISLSKGDMLELTIKDYGKNYYVIESSDEEETGGKSLEECLCTLKSKIQCLLKQTNNIS